MPHIVLIEDDVLLSEMYQNAIEAEGFQCSVALDGATGLQMVEQSLPDLVLLDLMIPQISGDQVLLKMRTNERTKNVKVIIMTNISQTEAPEILDSLEFERYIVKANTTLQEVIGIIKDMFQPVAVLE